MNRGKQLGHAAEMIVMEHGVCKQLQKFISTGRTREGEANMRVEVRTGTRSR